MSIVAEMHGNMQLLFGTWVWNILGIALALILKDIFKDFAVGFYFYFDDTFNEGETVFVDGERAKIIKMGFRTTVFEIERNDCRLWRYVKNSNVADVVLEKIITK